MTEQSVQNNLKQNTTDSSPEQQDTVLTEIGERISPREELIRLADEWIAAASDEQEKRALQATREELLLALDEGRKR
ncbi:MAG: hypothetical protein JO125_11635 [Chloroflexi bacterium]|nr:hypothetical protein [Ktedonobacteraceae bacterium]MBV8821628.1 hypothetical protein [Ktedonobacteraceae bacterium]MBV9021327.1 hypothetical protein [Ktedonobacteraceae bacterium]MBV9708045.1 hypothetical protein [Chloroflexota bacterium]